MKPDTEQRSKQLFEEALDLSLEQRNEWLSLQCKARPDLRARVEALLAAAEKDDGFLRDPGSVPTAFESAEEPGSTIGPYTLIERIGEGGFGTVFLADQLEPMRRRVALKIVKLGMDTRAVVARFEQERQALALMDHPNIARVFDAGVTRLGRPYFVMELVRGDPITTYCDREKLSIGERIALFAQVCRAVQHAHTKGVIHRDIKPSNILVGTVDGRACVKVIDFGIAKATAQRLSEKTVHTEFQQLLGTPEYMSPEQAAGSLDIDTRTDVYGLGVLLYELLTGTTPFDARELRGAEFTERQRILRDVDPPPPSTRISRADAAALADIAGLRRTPPNRIGALVRGELDWMVMRALDKDRARRYDSAGALAADVERYLQGEPVEAAPPRATYRWRKALRKHRLGVVAGAMVAAALVLGTGLALWQFRVAAAERDAARESARLADAARKESELHGRELEQVAEFEAMRLHEIDPLRMGARILEDLASNARQGMLRAGVDRDELELRQAELAELFKDVNATDLALRTLEVNIFDSALKAVDEQFEQQPAVQARLLQTLGNLLAKFGLLSRAEEPLLRALEIRRRTVGNADDDTLEAMLILGNLRLEQARPAEAEALFREVLRLRTTALGTDAEPTMRAANNLGLALIRQGKLREAEACMQGLLESTRRVLGPDHRNTIILRNNIGGILMEQERPAEAEPFFRGALEQFQLLLGKDASDALMCESNLALSLEKQERLAEAEPLYRDTLVRARRTQGEEHPQTLLYKSNLGFLLGSLGQLVEAQVLTSEALEARRRLLGDSHGETLQSMHNAAVLLVIQGEPGAAEAQFRQVLATYLAAADANPPAITMTRDALANLLSAQQRFSEAEALLLDSQREHEDSTQSSKPQRAKRMQALIALYEAWQQAQPASGHAQAAERWREALRKLGG